MSLGRCWCTFCLNDSYPGGLRRIVIVFPWIPWLRKFAEIIMTQRALEWEWRNWIFYHLECIKWLMSSSNRFSVQYPPTTSWKWWNENRFSRSGVSRVGVNCMCEMCECVSMGLVVCENGIVNKLWIFKRHVCYMSKVMRPSWSPQPHIAFIVARETYFFYSRWKYE